MDGEALLRAVIAFPADDTVRLVYADWLEELGDPRAEFIRIQVTLANGTADDRTSLELRERDLLAEYQTQWAAPLLGFVTGVQFCRGFPDWVTIDAQRFIDDGEHLFRVAPLRQVWFRNVAGLTDELAACPHLARLEAIDLDDNRLDDSELAEILRSPHLGRIWGLNLSANRVGIASLGALATAAFAGTLRALGLRSAVSDPAAMHALAPIELPRLRHLDLAANAIRDEIGVLTGSQLLSRIRTLDLSGNLLGGAPLATLAAASSVARLRHLFLNMNQVDDPSPLASSPQLHRLARLDLADNLLDDGRTHALSVGTGLRGVRTLILRSNFISDGGAGALAASRSLRLSFLDLSNNRIGPSGVVRLAKRRLHRLDLGNARDDPDARNAVDDEGAEAIAQSKRMSQLSVLRLDGTQIGDRGAAAIASSPHLGNLALLNVRDNPISDDVREALTRRFGSGVAVN